jgi:TATA-box binding protein (TBP) (component of TFIID and TFIIIB)
MILTPMYKKEVGRSKMTILIFSSGKLVCAGASSEVEVEAAVNGIFNTLAERGLVPRAE